MSTYFPGVLNTGRRRYAHPALAGVLPNPWLPLKPGESLLAQTEAESESTDPDHPSADHAKQVSVVLSFGRKVRKLGKKAVGVSQNPSANEADGQPMADATGAADEGRPRSGVNSSSLKVANRTGERPVLVDEDDRNPWLDSSREGTSRGGSIRRTLSFDPSAVRSFVFFLFPLGGIV